MTAAPERRIYPAARDVVRLSSSRIFSCYRNGDAIGCRSMSAHLKASKLLSIISPAVFLALLLSAQPAAALDLREATIFCAPKLAPAEKKAVLMLEEEVEKRSRIRWAETNRWPRDPVVIAVGPVSKLEQFAGPFVRELRSIGAGTGPEGYRLCVRKSQAQSAVFVIGNDSRGVLFGVGRLLRELQMGRSSVSLDDGIAMATAPKYPL